MAFVSVDGHDDGVDIHESLWAAATAGDLDIIQYLVERGANVHHQLDSALRWSANNGHLPVVQYLIEQCGSDVHADHDSALCWSAENGHLPVVQYLVEHGANVHAEDDYALRSSATNGHLSVVQYLVEHGADVHADEDYALCMSSRIGYLPIVQYLVQAGADIHAREYNIVRAVVRQGPTRDMLLLPPRVHSALRISASGGHLPVVRYLLKQGAHIRIPHVESDPETSALDRLYAIGCNDAYEVAYNKSNRVRRFLVRQDFSYYMEKSVGWGCRPTEMLSVKNHHTALVRAMYTTMDQRTAMDVQHLVVEMLVGTSTVAYFRKARNG